MPVNAPKQSERDECDGDKISRRVFMTADMAEWGCFAHRLPPLDHSLRLSARRNTQTAAGSTHDQVVPGAASGCFPLNADHG